MACWCSKYQRRHRKPFTIPRCSCLSCSQFCKDCGTGLQENIQRKVVLGVYSLNNHPGYFEFSRSMCTLKVKQPQEILYGKLNQSIFITCHINTSCQSKQVQWYVIKTDSYYQLDLLSNHPIKYRLQGTDLHISWLSHSDDGMYYCTASDKHSTNSGAQDIGTGTILTVKENNYGVVQVLLFTLLALLSLCNLIIWILFICIKTGRVTLLKERQSQSQDKGESARTVHFGAVLQELYSKRNLHRNKKNTSTEVAQENKVKNPQTNRGREDIYQNLKRA